jgi:hypothetical protein
MNVFWIIKSKQRLDLRVFQLPALQTRFYIQIIGIQDETNSCIEYWDAQKSVGVRSRIKAAPSLCVYAFVPSDECVYVLLYCLNSVGMKFARSKNYAESTAANTSSRARSFARLYIRDFIAFFYKRRWAPRAAAARFMCIFRVFYCRRRSYS